MAQVRLETPEGGELILDGEFSDLTPEDKEIWQCEVRRRREFECFAVINRGKPWYDRLTQEQAVELDTWYHSWLDAPGNGVMPHKPHWID